jgi:hypothetical protein
MLLLLSSLQHVNTAAVLAVGLHPLALLKVLVLPHSQRA